MPNVARFIGSAALIAAALLAGCAKPAQPVAMELPVIQPEPQGPREPTLLERYQQVGQQLDAEKVRSAALAADLAEQKQARAEAESELAQLRLAVAALERKSAEMEQLAARYEESQKTCLALESSVRELRRNLLEARLTGAKHEQTILAMKIDRAMERRKQTIERTTDAAPASNTSTEKRNHVATP